jgi:GNAT superfamily N-acetyltransferase
VNSAAPAHDESTEPVLLSGAGFAGRARASSIDRSLAHLTIFDPNTMPTGVVLDAWLGELSDRGFSAVRTGAVTERAARQLEQHGFRVTQQLTLLSLDLASWSPAAHIPTRRLTPRRFAEAAAADAAAFRDGWAMDPAMIDDTCNATPFHRARWTALDGGADLQAYAVTGRSGRHGFVQRLAVHPDAHRHGLGRGLLDDGLRWLRRWRAHQVFVNTQVDNEPALQLYAAAGFVALPEGLRVLERSWR